MELTRGRRQEPQRIVVYGPEGIGKSTLASQLPDPAFIDVEGSTSDLDVDRTPTPSSWRALLDTASDFITDHHGKKTLVVDTADWAEKIAIAPICVVNNLTSLGGQDDFGKSYNLLETEWCRFLDLLSRVVASGMHVCLTAHAGIKNVRQPDLDKGYDRWELKMEKKTAAATKEWARTVLFLNYKTYVVEGKDKRKMATGGHRVMYAAHTPAFDGKNRAGLPEEMRLEYAAISALFDFSASSPQQPKKNPQAASQPASPPPTEKPAEPRHVQQQATAPAVPPPAGHLRPLFDLIQRDSVSQREVQLAVAKRGYYPADTPLENYDPKFVAGKLVAYWPQVVKWIETIRTEAAI